MKYLLLFFVTLLCVYCLSSCRLTKRSPEKVTDIDGNVYSVVKIGKQLWLRENLNVSHYSNGDSIPYYKYEKVIYHFTSGKYCDYENKPENSAIYGKLYNWYATVDRRNLCPSGWHVPSDKEWLTLTTYLGGDSVAGGKLKDSTVGVWQSPNVGATNEAGFSALLGGVYYKIGTFSSIGNYGYWWSTTKHSPEYALGFCMNYFSKNVSCSNHNMENYFSVRCIKNPKNYIYPSK